MAGFLSSVPTVPVYSMALICLLSFVSMRAGHLGSQQIFIKGRRKQGVLSISDGVEATIKEVPIRK